MSEELSDEQKVGIAMGAVGLGALALYLATRKKKVSLEVSLEEPPRAEIVTPTTQLYDASLVGGKTMNVLKLIRLGGPGKRN